MIVRRCLCGILTGLLWLSILVAAAPTPNPTVTLDAGVVVGTAVTVARQTPVGDAAQYVASQNGTNGTTMSGGPVVVNEFLGIPYAQSPPLRFAPPTAAKPWSSPIDASQYKPVCTQEFIGGNASMSIFNNPGGVPPQESEDCLYINVFAPATRSPPGGRTVMFWIYGGALQFGGSANDAYNGTLFAANQDVILVSFNYRTNVFGFPNAPDIPADQQNAGFLDQRFALQWVQDNIVNFGGSPDKVTIFGESAGGYSVKQLVALPPQPVPFRAAILESEATVTAGTGPAAWASLVAALNCTGSASELACVRAAPASTIKNIEETQSLGFNPFFNNITAINDTGPIFSSGGGSSVPFLIGTNGQEGRVFAYEDLLASPNITLDQYVQSIIPSSVPQLQQAIEALYPTSQFPTPYFQIAALITDLEFLCPASLLANDAAGSGAYDVWRYYFNATFPNTQIFPDAGAYHSSEIPEVFGTYPTALATEQEINLSITMQSAWANFAKNPTQGPGWPKLGSNGGTELGVLGANGTAGVTVIPQSMVDSVCSTYGPVLAVIGV